MCLMAKQERAATISAQSRPGVSSEWSVLENHAVRNSVPLSASEMLGVASHRGLQDWELQPVQDATMKDIDPERVEADTRQRSARSRSLRWFENIEQFLVGG